MSRLGKLIVGIGTCVVAAIAFLAFIFDFMEVSSKVAYTWNRIWGVEKPLNLEITTVGQFVELAKGKTNDGSIEIFLAEDGLLDDLNRLRIDPESEVRKFAGDDYRDITQQVCRRLEGYLECSWSSSGEKVEMNLRHGCVEERTEGPRYLICPMRC